MSLGGADVAWAQDPLGALGANPAGLARLADATVELNVVGALADGRFTNRQNRDGHLTKPYAVIPEAALGVPIARPPLTLGFALMPEATLSADWRYVDSPGGLDGKTSYGRQQHHAEIILLRSANGVGVDLGPKWALGGSLGLLYNRNTLEVPCIFQSQPALRGFKTLLDLETDGFGYNGNVGLLFRPHERWQIGLAYTTKTTIHTEGNASGDAAAQLASLGGAFAMTRPDFKHDAEVINHFPQTVKAGLSWNVHARARLALQVDWINWGDAFHELQIKLAKGNNAELNALVGANAAEDVVPLRWRDRLAYRTGVEIAATENLSLRAGYSYGKSPVPSGTLTPLTAAIMEHTVALGLGYELKRYEFNFAWQYDLPIHREVGASQLRSGEYSNSRVEVGIHWFAASVAVKF